jgi:uncharacterized protein YndB with AHSA1/START domain
MPLRHHVRKGFKNITKTIEKQRVIHTTPERTFQALTEKEELERWFVQKAEGDVRPGGARHRYPTKPKTALRKE